MATISRLLKNLGLFCKRALQKRQYSAKETCDIQKRPVIFKEPTNRSHPIVHIIGEYYDVICESTVKCLIVQPIAFGVSFLQSRISIDNLVL